MGDNIEAKEGEQYPLLKTDSGGGDNNVRLSQPLNDITAVCNITRTPKRSWLDRWPACCIAFIVFAIAFLTFFTLGFNVSRRPMLVVKYNNSKQAGTIFYHHIIPDGAYVPFIIYSRYLSHVAMQYPLLDINVIFLMDDSTPNRHVRLFKKFSQVNTVHDSILDLSNKKEMRNIQKRHPNVNITIMALSKYMSLTPYRYKWRTIPAYYLNFYVRIFAVWQYGGIAMDLTTYNNLFSLHQTPDCRISAILKQHNDGIENGKYIDVLKRMNLEEQNELFTIMYMLINHVFNQTTNMLNMPFWSKDHHSTNLSIETPELSSKRIKRHSNHSRLVKAETDLYGLATDDITINTTLGNYTNDLPSPDIQINQYITNNSESHDLKVNPEQITNISTTENLSFVFLNSTEHTQSRSEKVLNTPSVSGKVSPVVLYYDISFISDNMPVHLESMDHINETSHPRHRGSPQPMSTIYDSYNRGDHSISASPILSISSDGTFVAAPSKHHPLLNHLIACGFQNVSPTYAINKALMTQCSGFNKLNISCDNIYVL